MGAILENCHILFEDFCKQQQVDSKIVSIKLANKFLKLKIASTPESLMKGYMDSPEPKENEGILFVYDKSVPLQFWMKNVNFPLDIIFFDSKFNYVNHLTMAPDSGKSDSLLPRYNSQSSAQFALELKAGWCDRNNITNKCKLKI